MIPILLMIFGGLLILLTMLGILAYFSEPVLRSIRIVILREDDYAHYTSPDTLALLRREKKNYFTYLALLGTTGLILFCSGYYMKYGARGLNTLLAISDESPEEGAPAKGIDEAGNYSLKDGRTYERYFVVKGERVYYRSELIGGAEDLEPYLKAHEDELSHDLLLVDNYATAESYRAVASCLGSEGYQYEETAD